VRTEWYWPVDVKSMESHKLRRLVAVRSRLVSMGTALYNQVRGLLKTFGVVPAPGKGWQPHTTVSPRRSTPSTSNTFLPMSNPTTLILMALDDCCSNCYSPGRVQVTCTSSDASEHLYIPSYILPHIGLNDSITRAKERKRSLASLFLCFQCLALTYWVTFR
jgi:hypothetical protein